MKYSDIRSSSDEEKGKIYEEIDTLYRQGGKVGLKEHKSGPPAVTVDCGDIHVLTDIFSLEEWWILNKKQVRCQLPEKLPVRNSGQSFVITDHEEGG